MKTIKERPGPLTRRASLRILFIGILYLGGTAGAWADAVPPEKENNKVVSLVQGVASRFWQALDVKGREGGVSVLKFEF